MNNELMINLKSGDYLYFETKQATADKAFQEFQERCDDIGLNIDNLEFEKAVLRDQEGVDIDSLQINKSEEDECMKTVKAGRVESITLLSVNEYMQAKDVISDIFIDTSWWLRSAGIDDPYAAFVYGKNGDVRKLGCLVRREIGVRPALRISHLDEFGLKRGDRVTFAGYSWTVISDNLTLCDEIVGTCAFRKNWGANNANDFGQSDVKKWLENWARENFHKENEHV